MIFQINAAACYHLPSNRCTVGKLRNSSHKVTTHQPAREPFTPTAGRQFPVRTLTPFPLSTCTPTTGRQFSVLRYESVIHEFDPYFNYRSTIKLVQEGFYEFWVSQWGGHVYLQRTNVATGFQEQEVLDTSVELLKSRQVAEGGISAWTQQLCMPNHVMAGHGPAAAAPHCHRHCVGGCRRERRYVSS